MNPTKPLVSLRDPDRIGIAASVLCAVHCAAAPSLLLFAPTFGRAWGHPASHGLVAALVVPLAAAMIWKGQRRHGRRWVCAVGGIGIALVIAGALLPFLGAEAVPGGSPAATAASCCPSVNTDAAGLSRIEIPPASIVTTLGGFALIATHLGNLCGCSTCRRP